MSSLDPSIICFYTPSWKEGWHRHVAPHYLWPHFMQKRHRYVATLYIELPTVVSRERSSSTALSGARKMCLLHIPMPRIFQGHRPVPPPFPWRHIHCVFSMLNWQHRCSQPSVLPQCFWWAASCRRKWILLVPWPSGRPNRASLWESVVVARERLPTMVIQP